MEFGKIHDIDGCREVPQSCRAGTKSPEMNVSGAGLSKKSKIFRIGCVDIFLEPLKVGGKSGKSVNPG